MAGIGSTPALLVATAVGGAAAAAFEPALEVPRQQAWKDAPHRILDPELLARLVAQGGVDLSSAQAEALLDGYSADKVDALVYLAQTVPGIGQALDLWRKGLITAADFAHVLVKDGLDQRYSAPILALKDAELIGIGDIATAIVRGAVPAPPWVPVAPPATTDNVPRFPVTNLDPVALAAKLGYDEDMLRIMTARSGLSLAPILATQALFRGVITHNDWLLAIAEGDLRTEWADTLRDAARQIPTADQAAELQLRGFLTESERRAQAARHGMTNADSDLVYDVLGRGLSIRQTYIGEARGGTYDGTPQSIPEPYLSAAQRSNLRPEWYSLAYENRYSLPSAFVTRALLSDGAITEARGEEIFLHSGWPPDLAALVANHYAAGTPSGADTHVAKAQTQLWTTTHRAYLNGKATDAEATSALTAAGVSSTAIPQVLSLWREERTIDRKTLSAAQTKKAWVEQVVNPATGQPWTRDEALAALIALGYSANDAATFLEL